ncbi:alpha/beta-hydrolase [Crassisporium funariophilum]|nr:alpha/beta-hydrolase [Crassisporium funariophilum]
MLLILSYLSKLRKMWPITLQWGLLLGVVAASARQNILQVPNSYQSYDHGLFKPAEDLSILSETEFTTLSHPAFPRYGVRIKKSTFCDETVKSYTGYIDIEARHLFFYFFESRNDPDKDDVIFWTNGGPGCSSSLGLFMELGPCRVLDANGTKFHPESWNSNANIFFVDQPIGVGFSYAEYGETVGTTEEAAKDIASFVSIFFEHFTKFKGRAFHMAGESYGGRYIPVFASEVYDQNARLVEAGLTPINLASIMIGNGITDFFSMIPSYFDMACTPVSVPPILDISTCVRMKQALPRCQKWMKESCVDQFDSMSCGAAMSFCDAEIGAPFFNSKKNPYDISKDCEGEISDTLCYPVTKHISSYLDRPSVRKLLGVSDSLNTTKFTSCSNNVGRDFAFNMDEFHPTQYHVAALLERGIKALIYVGRNDWICNHVGNEKWTSQLEWSGGAAFSTQALREWNVGGKKAGMTRSANGLTFATIDGAGHMVPYDKPKESLELINRWLSGQELTLQWSCVLGIITTSAQQTFLELPSRHNSFDQCPFNPIEDLSVLSETEFTTLGHPAFPSYGVRIKKSSFCDATVKSYTGYIDIEARHLFFYFFESRSDPDKDDVIFWINGGPGCSSSMGLFMELGPCRILDANGTKFHPESWNSNANIFFLDQPVGVGFSYADYGESVSTTEQASKDIAAFVAIFFEHFSKFKGRAFHMAGESYAGRYLPVFAADIYDQNARLVEAGLTPVNLTSIMIGNGLTDFFTMMASYFEMACTPMAVAPILDINTCVRMKQALPRCKAWTQSFCIDQFDSMMCDAAMGFCSSEMWDPVFASGINPYDISQECDGGVDDTLCYPAIEHISNYLDRSSVRKALGVSDTLNSTKFSACSKEVEHAFFSGMDQYHPTSNHVAALLERKVKVLIFVGKNDWVCNYLGNERWTMDLDWSGGEEFSGKPLREWSVDGKKAGMTRSAQGLTFAIIEGSGHMVPYDKPEESLEMVNRWLSGKEL